MQETGKKKDFSSEQLRRASAISAKFTRQENIKTSSTTLNELGSAQAVVEGIILGLYEFNKYVTVEKKKLKSV